jgi:hypothetical protein
MYQPGQSGNLNGRKPGIPNRLTTVNREFLQMILDQQGPKIRRELRKLTGIDYLRAITWLMEYSLPKLQKTQLMGADPDEPRQSFIVGGREIFF